MISLYLDVFGFYWLLEQWHPMAITKPGRSREMCEIATLPVVFCDLMGAAQDAIAWANLQQCLQSWDVLRCFEVSWSLSAFWIYVSFLHSSRQVHNSKKAAIYRREWVLASVQCNGRYWAKLAPFEYEAIKTVEWNRLVLAQAWKVKSVRLVAWALNKI